MPTYTFSCPSCGHKEDATTRVSARNDPRNCSSCANPTERIQVAPQIGAMGHTSGSFSVVSPITGQLLESKSAYEGHMKKHNVVPQSDLKGQVEHVQKRQEAEHKKDVRESVEDAFRAANR